MARCPSRFSLWMFFSCWSVLKWLNGGKKNKKTTMRKLDTVRVKMDFTELLSQLLVYKICFRQLFIMSKTADDIFVQCWETLLYILMDVLLITLSTAHLKFITIYLERLNKTCKQNQLGKLCSLHPSVDIFTPTPSLLWEFDRHCRNQTFDIWPRSQHNSHFPVLY